MKVSTRQVPGLRRARRAVGRAVNSAGKRLSGVTRSEAPGGEEPTIEPYATFYDGAATRRLMEDWGGRHPEQLESPYFRTHAGRFAYLVEAIRDLGVEGACIDVAGTSRTHGLFTENTDLASHELTPEVDVEIDDWADVVGVGAFDLAVFSEVIEHLNADPAKALHEINRCLRPGGYLLLTTVNVASELGLYQASRGEAPYAMANLFGTRGDRHQREYAPLELQRLVAAHGFESWVRTVNLYPEATVKHEARAWAARQPGFDPALHGDTIVVIGRKVATTEGPLRLHPVYHESVSANARGTVPGQVAALLRQDWPGPGARS